MSPLEEEARKRAVDLRYWRAITPVDPFKEPHTGTLLREAYEAGEFIDRLADEIVRLQSELAAYTRYQSPRK